MIQQISSHKRMLYSNLFSFRRKIVLWLLRRFFSQTPLVWGNLPHGIFAAGGAFVPTQEKKNSTGLKSSRTRRVLCKSLEENYSAQIKERSLFGQIMCSGETQKRFLNWICLARIALWLHPPLKILVCLSLSRVVLLHRIKIPYNLILLQRITFAVNSSKNILLYEG